MLTSYIIRARPCKHSDVISLKYTDTRGGSLDWISRFQSGFLDFRLDFWISEWISGFQSGFLDFRVDFWISKWISGFQSGFLDFRVDFWISKWISGFQSGFLDFKVDFWISEWISGFQSGFLDFKVDFWISEWISGFRWISLFQIGFLPTVYEISFVADPSRCSHSCNRGQKILTILFVA